MTLTAKADIVFTFGEVGGSWSFAKQGESLELVSEHSTNYIIVKNKDGDEMLIDRDKVLFP